MRGASDDNSLHLKAPVNAVGKSTVSVLLEHGTPIVRLELEGVSRDLIIDTGSNISLLQPGVTRRDISVTSVKLFGVTGEVLDLKGQLTVSFVLGGHEFEHTFYVCPHPTDAAGLIGTDFLERAGAIISFECAKISFSDIGKVPHVHSVSPARHPALTVFTRGKEGHRPQPRQQEARQTDGFRPAPKSRRPFRRTRLDSLGLWKILL